MGFIKGDVVRFTRAERQRMCRLIVGGSTGAFTKNLFRQRLSYEIAVVTNVVNGEREDSISYVLWPNGVTDGFFSRRLELASK